MKIGLIRHLILAALICLPGYWSPAIADEASDSESTAERQALLKEMRRAATAIKVGELSDSKSIQADLVEEPLFRYSDEQRQIRDATMWVWTVHGRPVSLMKLECYGFPDPEKRWLFNIVSTTPQTLDVQWPFNRRFSSKQPNMKFRPFDGRIDAAESKTGRLIQLKQIARRFNATMTGDSDSSSKTEMRLLTTPLFRYSSEPDKIIDGALFGMSATGTNPDAILAIQWRREPTSVVCEYALTGMTIGGLDVRLDETPVWKQPYLLNQGQEFDTWTWFFSARTE